MAEFALGNRDDAHDAVQEAMCALVERYATRPPDEWAPLFYRILDTRITDEHRRRSAQRRWLGTRQRREVDDDEDADGLAVLPAAADWEPDVRYLNADTIARLDAAIRALPLRQRQVLLLRAWEGLDVRDTAAALGCAEGTVKAHHFRALERLRAATGDEFP